MEAVVVTIQINLEHREVKDWHAADPVRRRYVTVFPENEDWTK